MPESGYVSGQVFEKVLINEEGVVRGVRLKGGEEISSKIVASSCTPKVTFQHLFEDFELDYKLDYWIEKIRGRGTTAKVHLALNKEIELNGQSIEFARTGNTFDEMEKAFDPVKYGEVTSEPFLDIHIPTFSNPSLAPDGHSVVSVLVHQIPYHLKSGWTDEAKKEIRYGCVAFPRGVRTRSYGFGSRYGGPYSP